MIDPLLNLVSLSSESPILTVILGTVNTVSSAVNWHIHHTFQSLKYLHALTRNASLGIPQELYKRNGEVYIYCSTSETET